MKGKNSSVCLKLWLKFKKKRKSAKKGAEPKRYEELIPT